MVKDTTTSYGIITISLHWIMALLMIALFILGVYMVELDYYDSWYHKAPDVHRSLGMITGLLLILRLIWRYLNPRPTPLGTPLEKKIGKLVHYTFYLLLLLIVVSGYLISTADGKPINVFDWVKIPATLTSLENQEDKAGTAHLIIAYFTMLLVLLHTTAALKHHYWDRDATLLRMFGKTGTNN